MSGLENGRRNPTVVMLYKIALAPNSKPVDILEG
ncbi:MAG: hypothetical protein Q7T60_10910 [Sphingopyxis sp.]|nr:hypothetical protein [Sphingopyxis sp.]